MLSQTAKGLVFFSAVGGLLILVYIYDLIQFLYLYLRPGSVKKYNKSSGAWALVTGSSDGIGLAIVHELCSEGFNIILHGRNLTKLSRVQSSLSASFPKTQFRTFVADGAAPTEVMSHAILEFVNSIKDLNLTLLINNVGGTANMAVDFTMFIDHTTKEIEDLISINMLFTTHLTRALLPILIRNESALILNTGSQASTGLPYISVYSATKAYLSAWGNALSIELQSEGFNVEVLTVLSGNTQSGQDHRAANLFRPTSRTFARAALAKVGCGRTVVTGYFWHAFQNVCIGLFPVWVQRRGVIMALRPYKGKNLDS